ncbi:MAG: ATP-binding protein, partial [Thermoguttaceae bacterium]|nr:ATP-binding protein [Thermoguttaceae bacterium]
PIHHEGRALACMTVGSHTLERVPEQARTSLEAVAAQVGGVIARITAQEAQKRNELKYRLLAENLKDVVFSMDLEGRVTYCSPAVREFSGYDPAEAIGKNVREFIPSDDEWRRAWAIVAQMVRDQVPASTEVPYRRKDGSVIPVEITGKPLVEDGRVVSIQCVMRDISERRRNEEELRQAKLAAEAASRAKSEFLTNISHEIRTPMTAILGFAEILMGTLPEGESLHAARTIRRNGEHLMEIINDILDLSKIEAGRFEIRRDRCSPHQILDDVVSLMRVRASAKGLPLTLEFEGPLPATIATDPVRLRQILINLVGNAIKFTEAGEVRLRARLINHAGEPKLECEVIDTGIGMSEEQVKRLFRPFTQGDATTSRRFGGTGLGLTISKRLAAMLDGDIAVQSVPGKGSTFRLTVATGSLEGVPIVEAGEAIRASPEGAAPLPSAESLAGSRILLAEDGPDNQRLIAYLLRKAGADVVVVANGQEAVERALVKSPRGEGEPVDVRPFDLILMDLQMPVMDGYEATRILRQQGVDTPIVALSAHAMVEMAQQCLATGFDDYASKPIDRAQLLTLAAKYVARYRGGRASGEAAARASGVD